MLKMDERMTLALSTEEHEGLRHGLRRKIVPYEIIAVQNFCNAYLNNEDPWVLINTLFELDSIDQQLLRNLRNSKRAGFKYITLWQTLLDELSFTFYFNDLVKLFYDHYSTDLAKKLLMCRTHLLMTIGQFTIVGRIEMRNQKVSEFFKHTKTTIHENKYSHQQLLSFCDILEKRIKNEKNEKRRKLLCDKYIAQLAATGDFMFNTSVSVSLQNDVFQKIEAYANYCSNPDLACIILRGRQGDALSTIGEFSEGENYMRAAYVFSDKALPCIEITDMYYKNVVFKLAEFEANPTKENQRQVLFESERALSALSVEDEDLQELWKRLILLRRAFVFIGVGKQCKIVKNYFPNEKCLAKGEMILKDPLLKRMEVRKKMLKNVANSRLHYLKFKIALGQDESEDNALVFLEKSVKYMKKAEQNALTGKYSELEAIQEQLKSLKEKCKDMHLPPKLFPGSKSLPSTQKHSTSDSNHANSFSFEPSPFNQTEIQHNFRESETQSIGDSLYNSGDFKTLNLSLSSELDLSEEKPLHKNNSDGSLPSEGSNISIEFESSSERSLSTDESADGPEALFFSDSDRACMHQHDRSCSTSTQSSSDEKQAEGASAQF